MKNDEKIWNDFCRGENYALSYIYSNNIHLLFRYGRKFSKDNELIKDTIQDLFFDLIRTRENLGATDNIRYYLLCSFRRKLFKNLSRQKSNTEGGYVSVPVPEISYSIEQELISKEYLTLRDKRIKKGLSELTTKQREILFYRYTCGFEYEEICNLMSLKYDSARKQVFRALKALKVIMIKDNVLILLSMFSKNGPKK
ncbi:RNA polymerase sigma factor [Draconibacterium halophilum]|uniref:Sigma-70 family RNA polymerase sigma factor n=1 Tax=Draconibacterium halophilum TaxID=2706887 RepID=A0A6C0RFN7_9BACT|nr:sigma-70 family RNA polymerase sigma factor [Draconibacterium halophilum]QIA08343.1 sigma-70 family RNA polymerase sigma factor [Draconibacterium halophilum]